MTSKNNGWDDDLTRRRRLEKHRVLCDGVEYTSFLNALKARGKSTVGHIPKRMKLVQAYRKHRFRGEGDGKMQIDGLLFEVIPNPNDDPALL